MSRVLIDRNSIAYIRNQVPRDAARMASSKNLGDTLEIKAEFEALYQQRMAAEKAKRIAYEEAQLERMKEDLMMAQESMAETKEEIAEAVTKWFSENEIEPDAVLTTVQKDILNRALYLLKKEEQMLAMDIDMAVAQVRNASRSLRNEKGIAPTAEEKAQEDAEKAAERRFNELSRRAAIPQYVREDLYESSEYEHDIVDFWNQQSEKCERIIKRRDEEMLERINKQCETVMV
jgi:ribosomal protein L23